MKMVHLINVLFFSVFWFSKNVSDIMAIRCASMSTFILIWLIPV